MQYACNNCGFGKPLFYQAHGKLKPSETKFTKGIHEGPETPQNCPVCQSTDLDLCLDGHDHKCRRGTVMGYCGRCGVDDPCFSATAKSEPQEALEKKWCKYCGEMAETEHFDNGWCRKRDEDKQQGALEEHEEEYIKGCECQKCFRNAMGRLIDFVFKPQEEPKKHDGCCKLDCCEACDTGKSCADKCDCPCHQKETEPQEALEKKPDCDYSPWCDLGWRHNGPCNEAEPQEETLTVVEKEIQHIIESSRTDDDRVVRLASFVESREKMARKEVLNLPCLKDEDESDSDFGRSFARNLLRREIRDALQSK